MERIIDADKLFDIVCAQPTISKGMVKRLILQLQKEIVHCGECAFVGEFDCPLFGTKQPFDKDFFCAKGAKDNATN